MDDDRKRRNCADRVRYAAEMRKIQRGRRIDPAMSVVIQLAALFSLGLRLLPGFSTKATPAPSMSLPSAPRVPLPVPGAAEPYERYKGTPSWQRVVKDLARPGRASEDAQREVRSRLPVECAPWLDVIFRDHQWGEIRIHAPSGATDADVVPALVAAARSWEADRRAAKAQALAELKAQAEGGGAASAAMPGEGTGWARKL